MENREWYAVVHIGNQNCIGWYSKKDQAEKRIRRTTAPLQFEVVNVREILEGATDPTDQEINLIKTKGKDNE